jgi:hypothetical protein
LIGDFADFMSLECLYERLPYFLKRRVIDAALGIRTPSYIKKIKNTDPSSPEFSVCYLHYTGASFQIPISMGD